MATKGYRRTREGEGDRRWEMGDGKEGEGEDGGRWREGKSTNFFIDPLGQAVDLRSSLPP